MTRALEPTEIAVFGADAIVGPDNIPISQSTLKLAGNVNHEAGLERAAARAAGGPLSEAALKMVLDLVKDSSSDQATKARVEKIAAAAQQLRVATAADEKSSRELDAKRLLHLKQMADERATNAAAIDRDTAALRASRLAGLDEREAALAAGEKALAADKVRIGAQQVELEKKLAHIREAAR